MFNRFITHNGRFHTDEITAFSIINYINPDIELIRTRDTSIIENAINDKKAIIADVGRILSPDDNAFDHHFYDSNLESFMNDNINSVSKTLLHLSTSISEILISQYNTNEELGQKGLKNIIKKVIKRYVENIEEQYTIEGFLVMKIDSLFDYLSTELPNYISMDTNIVLSLLEENIIEIKLVFLENIQYRKYSSAGLIWNTYGTMFIKEVISREGLELTINQDDIENIFKKIDKSIINEIDLEDNGFKRQDKNINTLSSIVSAYGLRDLFSPEQDIQFKKASNLVTEYLYNNILKQIDVISDKNIFFIEFEEGNNIQIFSRYITGIEKLLYSEDINYVDYIVYPGENNTFNIKTIKKGMQFGDHIALPKEWLINKPEGLIFCHNGLFIAQFTHLHLLLSAIK